MRNNGGKSRKKRPERREQIARNQVIRQPGDQRSGERAFYLSFGAGLGHF
jgi:hypothetical protein